MVYGNHHTTHILLWREPPHRTRHNYALKMETRTTMSHHERRREPPPEWDASKQGIKRERYKQGNQNEMHSQTTTKTTRARRRHCAKENETQLSKHITLAHFGFFTYQNDIVLVCRRIAKTQVNSRVYRIWAEFIMFGSVMPKNDFISDLNRWGYAKS